MNDYTCLSEMQKEVHELSKAKGWYDCLRCAEHGNSIACTACKGTGIVDRNVPEMLALIHSEISEALEDWRENDMALSFEGQKPVGFGTELADAVIRIMDLCEYLKIPLGHLILTKHNYNTTRPHRHGGKRA